MATTVPTARPAAHPPVMMLVAWHRLTWAHGPPAATVAGSARCTRRGRPSPSPSPSSWCSTVPFDRSAHPPEGHRARHPGTYRARRTRRSACFTSMTARILRPRIAAAIRALLQRGLITQGGKERPASCIRSLPNRWLPKLTRHAWTAICRSVRYGWLDGWSDGELPAAAGGSRRGGYPGRAARAHPAAGWLDGHDGPVPGYRIERVHSGMRSAISADAAAGPGTGSRRAAGPRPDAADQGGSGGDRGHVRQVGVRSQGMSVSDGQAAVHSGACRSVRLAPEPAWGTCWVRGFKSGPVDVPALMAGLPHSAEPRWHFRRGVFSRLLTFTARRPATGSGVIAAARTTAARWPRSGSWRRSGRRRG